MSSSRKSDPSFHASLFFLAHHVPNHIPNPFSKFRGANEPPGILRRDSLSTEAASPVHFVSGPTRMKKEKLLHGFFGTICFSFTIPASRPFTSVSVRCREPGEPSAAEYCSWKRGHRRRAGKDALLRLCGLFRRFDVTYDALMDD